MNVRSRCESGVALIALATLGILFTFCSPASAGTYTVNQCNSSIGAGESGWGYVTSPGGSWAGGLSGCNGFNQRIASWNGSSYYFPYGYYLAYRSPTLTNGRFIRNVAFEVAGGTGGGMTRGSVRMCGTTASNPTFPGICDATQSVSLIGPPDILWTNASVTGCTAVSGTLPGQCTSIQFMLERLTAYGDGSTRGEMLTQKMAFTIDDSTNPTATLPVAGSTIAYDNWNRGNVTVAMNATDNGGGIQNQRLFRDGDVLNNISLFTNTCNHNTWTPCPTNDSRSAIVATGGLADGAHTITNRATDVASNTNDSTKNFKVDNTAPSEPADVSPSGSSTASWSATNDFNIDWTNGSETVETLTASGLSHVVIDLAPADNADPDPAPVVVPIGGSASGISATIDTLSGVVLPAEGQYRYGVGVRDLAGNWSGNVTVDGNNNPTGVTIDTSDNGPSLGYDPNPPAAPAGRANGWISRAELTAGYDQGWSYNAPLTQVSPICGFSGKISQTQIDDPGTTINIPGDVREWQLPADLEEATHFVHLRAVTCAGLASPTTEHVEAKVDLTDPTPNFAGVEEGRWYRDGKQVTIGGEDVLSGMAPSTTSFFTDGAYIDYSINGDSPVDKPRGNSASVIVTGEGQKELSFSPVDVAGNKSKATVVRFGIDASNPTGHFEPRDTERPRLLRAALADSVSGLDSALIEVRRKGSSDAWKLLPTGLADFSGAGVAGFPKAALAQATFPDTSLPNGTYEARVRTFDQAGNELTTSKDRNGNNLEFNNPMRDGVALSAGLFKAKRVCKKKKGVRCIKKYRGKVVFTGAKPTLAVAYKRGAVVQGFLATNRYGALARQPIEIYTKEKNKPEQLVGTTSTRTDGSYVFKLRPGVSRTVRVYYPGTELRQDASATVNLGTGAKLKLTVSKKRAKTGQTVTFRGNVTAFDKTFPASGKIIALQFYAGKKWRPAVAIARTDAKGRFSVKYKFDRMPKSVKARIVFRVIAPAEDGWGHATSASRRITMRVN